MKTSVYTHSICTPVTGDHYSRLSYFSVESSHYPMFSISDLPFLQSRHCIYTTPAPLPWLTLRVYRKLAACNVVVLQHHASVSMALTTTSCTQKLRCNAANTADSHGDNCYMTCEDCRFMRACGARDSQWRDGRQHDAQEYLRSILEAMQVFCCTDFPQPTCPRMMYANAKLLALFVLNDFQCSLPLRLNVLYPLLHSCNCQCDIVTICTDSLVAGAQSELVVSVRDCKGLALCWYTLPQEGLTE